MPDGQRTLFKNVNVIGLLATVAWPCRELAVSLHSSASASVRRATPDLEAVYAALLREIRS